MKTHKIVDCRTGQALFRGVFDSMRHCLESAVAEGVCLNHADLSGANLVKASLDGARMRHACLQNANLMGANLSEAALDGANFSGASLEGANLGRSSLYGCNFDGASFGGTDIQSSNIGGSLFSSPSAFSLDFRSAGNMKDCFYSFADGTACLMSRPPVVIHGLLEPMIFMDDHVMIGAGIYPLIALSNDNLPETLDINSIKLYK